MVEHDEEDGHPAQPLDVLSERRALRSPVSVGRDGGGGATSNYGAHRRCRNESTQKRRLRSKLDPVKAARLMQGQNVAVTLPCLWLTSHGSPQLPRHRDGRPEVKSESCPHRQADEQRGGSRHRARVERLLMIGGRLRLVSNTSHRHEA